MAQSWPGCPWAGFSFAFGSAAIAGPAGAVMAGADIVCTGADLAPLPAGAEFKGAPTGIEQSWPGCPCAGLSPAPGIALDACAAEMVCAALTTCGLGTACTTPGVLPFTAGTAVF